MNENAGIIAELASTLKDALKLIIKPGTQYALVDFPDYPNVGDSAIWLGQSKLLKDITGNDPSYVCTHHNFDKKEFQSAHPNGPIIITGGGNLGDIWKSHQSFREYILEHHRDRVIIQMPQSMKFSSDESSKKFGDLLALHPEVYLFVRDEASLTIANKFFPDKTCHTKLVPDAAFALGPIKRVNKPSHEIFMLLRTDSEQSSLDKAALNTSNSSSGDWLQDEAGFYQNAIIKARIKMIRSLALTRQKRRLTHYNTLAELRLDRGLKQLQLGHRVITDRLHAHILSILLGISHVVMDNNYGKIGGFIKAWTYKCKNITLADSAQDAINQIEKM